MSEIDLYSYRVKYFGLERIGTGMYEITRLGTRRETMISRPTVCTPSGWMPLETWRERVKQAIRENHKEELLERIREYCKGHYFWLHNETDLDDYAMQCLVLGAYSAWDDFSPEEN